MSTNSVPVERVPREIRDQIYEELLTSPTGYVQPMLLRNPEANPNLPLVALKYCDPYPHSTGSLGQAAVSPDANVHNNVDFAVLRVCSAIHDESSETLKKLYKNVLVLNLSRDSPAQELLRQEELNAQQEPSNALYRWPVTERDFRSDRMKKFYKKFRKIEIFLLPASTFDENAERVFDDIRFNIDRDILSTIINYPDSDLKEVSFALDLHQLHELQHDLIENWERVCRSFYYNMMENSIMVSRFFAFMRCYYVSFMLERFIATTDDEYREGIAEMGRRRPFQSYLKHPDQLYRPEHRFERLPDEWINPKLGTENPPYRTVDFKHPDGRIIKRNIVLRTDEAYESEIKISNPDWWDGFMLAFLHRKFGFDIFLNERLIWRDGVHMENSPYQKCVVPDGLHFEGELAEWMPLWYGPGFALIPDQSESDNSEVETDKD